jgi:hypothetical protein
MSDLNRQPTDRELFADRLLEATLAEACRGANAEYNAALASAIEAAPCGLDAEQALAVAAEACAPARAKRDAAIDAARIAYVAASPLAAFRRRWAAEAKRAVLTLTPAAHRKFRLEHRRR